MKLIIPIITIILLSQFSSALLISQVLYDPYDETKGEAIELYNPSNQAINLKGYTIKTKSSEKDATLPSIYLPPHEYFLIADKNTNLSADHSEAITLTNTDAGVALMKQETIIDSVGWGDPSSIKEGLYQGTPTSQIKEGYALLRIQNTNNNSNDFIKIIPNFQKNNLSSHSIHLFLEIKNTLTITKISIPDDREKEEIQLAPIPGITRYINCNITLLSDEDISAKASFLEKSYNFNLTRINKTHLEGKTILSLPFISKPGNYALQISAENTSKTLPIEILGVKGIDIDSRVLSFEGKNQISILGDSDMNTSDQPTIKNIGNTEIEIQITPSDLSSSKNKILKENFKFNFNETLLPNQLTPLDIFLIIPEMSAGTLQGNIEIFAK